MSLKDNLEKAEGDYGIGKGSGDWFNVAEGENRVRILTDGEPIAKHFIGKGQRRPVCLGKGNCQYCEGGTNVIKDDEGNVVSPSVKFLTYVIDRTDNDNKLAELPYTVMKAISELQVSEDWAFSETPMPYDVIIKYNPKETGSKMYSVMPSPKREPVSQEHLDDLSVRTDAAEVAERMRAKEAI